MSPGHKKQMAQAVIAEGLCSGRGACRILRLARATWWYRAGQRSDSQQQMVARLHALSDAHPRYGYRRIAALLRQEGWRTGKRQVQRLRRAEGLRVPPTKRKIVRRACRPRRRIAAMCGRGTSLLMPPCAAERCGC
jgi:putative transposase